MARSSCSRVERARATSAIADIRGFIGMVLDRPSTSPGARTSTSAAGTASARSATTTATRCCARRHPRRQPDDQQARSAGLRAVAAVGARRALLGVPGARAARLAHRVLGARHAASHHHRPPRRCERSRVPHHECGPRSPRPPRCSLRPPLMHQAMVRMDGEKTSKRSATGLRERVRRVGHLKIRLAAVANHYRTGGSGTSRSCRKRPLGSMLDDSRSGRRCPRRPQRRRRPRHARCGRHRSRGPVGCQRCCCPARRTRPAPDAHLTVTSARGRAVLPVGMISGDARRRGRVLHPVAGAVLTPLPRAGS